MVITVTDDRRTIVGVTGGTVVDYTQLQRLLTEKAKSCPAGDVVCREVAGSGASMVWLTSFPDFSAFFRLLFDSKPSTAIHSDRTTRNKALRLLQSLQFAQNPYFQRRLSTRFLLKNLISL